jgi:hypothetical protein
VSDGTQNSPPLSVGIKDISTGVYPFITIMEEFLKDIFVDVKDTKN